MSLLKRSMNRKPVIEPLFAVVLGASGGGKSGLVGTLGLKTLVIRTPVESHGGVSARSVSKLVHKSDNIVEVDIFDGAANADEAWANMMELLEDPELPKSFEVIAIDSITDMQLNVIHELTEWKKLTTTNTGARNKLAEPGADTEFLNELINKKLKRLHAQGMHVIMLAAATLITMGEDGGEVVAKPGILGTKPAELLNRSCPDVLLVNKVRDDEGTWSHQLLFYPKVTKESKTPAGVVTKTENFNMRVSHISSDKLPESAPARLDQLVEYRKQCFSGE